MAVGTLFYLATVESPAVGAITGDAVTWLYTLSAFSYSGGAAPAVPTTGQIWPRGNW